MTQFFSIFRNSKPIFIVFGLVFLALGTLYGLKAWQQSVLDQADIFLRTCMTKLSLNPEPLSERERLNTCKELRLAIFESNAHKESVQNLDPITLNHRFAARSMGVDSRVKFLLFYDPKYVAASVYCYYVFEGALKISQLSPQQFAYGVGGFTVLRPSVEGYSQWLVGPDGIACRERVKAGLQSDVIDLSQALEDSIAIIGINPVGIVSSALLPSNAVQLVKQEISQTLNHERIHAVQSICPSLDRLALSEWVSLTDAQKAEAARSHPGYKWEIPQSAAREYQALQYESDPAQVAELAGDCTPPTH